MSVPFLTSWLVSQEARVRQGGAQRIHGVPCPILRPDPLSLSFSLLLCLPPNCSLCLSVCPYASSDGFLYPATSPTWLGCPIYHSNP